MKFDDYPIGTKFLCIKSFPPFLTKYKIYYTFKDCTGDIGIFDNDCENNEYDCCWKLMGNFVLHSPAMKILFGVE